MEFGFFFLKKEPHQVFGGREKIREIQSSKITHTQTHTHTKKSFVRQNSKTALAVLDKLVHVTTSSTVHSEYTDQPVYIVHIAG